MPAKHTGAPGFRSDTVRGKGRYRLDHSTSREQISPLWEGLGEGLRRVLCLVFEGGVNVDLKHSNASSLSKHRSPRSGKPGSGEKKFILRDLRLSDIARFAR